MGLFDRFKKKKGIVEEILTRLECDCSIIQENDINNVMTIYHQALSDGKKEGYTPIMIVPSEMLIDIFDTEPRETFIDKSKQIDAKDLLKRLLNDSLPVEEEEDFDVIGEFSAENANHQFLSNEDLINKKIILAKIPTNKPWEVAAWIPMGGYNECPLPEEQVAVFKYWYDKYGAFPALVSTDVWELYVEKPPKTQEDAEMLAMEHFGFCGDIVWQGVGTVNALAGGLVDSSIWYFWWD